MSSKWCLLVLFLLLGSFVIFSVPVSASFPTLLSKNIGIANRIGSSVAKYTWNLPVIATTGDLFVAVISRGSDVTAIPTFESTCYAVSTSTGNDYVVACPLFGGQGSIGWQSGAATGWKVAGYQFASGTWSGIMNGQSASGTSATPDPPNAGGSYGLDDYTWVAFTDNGNGVACTGYPANYINTQTTGGGTINALCSATRDLTASAENPGTFNTGSSVSWISYTIAVRGVVPSYSTVLSVVSESSGANCAGGGVRIQYGLDNGDGGGIARDGVLQAGEVDTTSYVCNGSTGATGPPGSAGFNSLMLIQSEAQGANCANPGGGLNVRSGLDNGDGGGTARDGILQTGEVDVGPFYVCNGATGATGAQGPTGPQGSAGADGFNSLVRFTSEPSGANCLNGGIRTDEGLDNGDGGGVARDGTLQAGEIDGTGYTCNGTPGTPGAPGASGHQALVTSATEPSGVNCATGGVRVQSGTDTNDDGVLQVGEVTSTSYACNGAQGPAGPQGPPGSGGGSSGGPWTFLLFVIILGGAAMTFFAIPKKGF